MPSREPVRTKLPAHWNDDPWPSNTFENRYQLVDLPIDGDDRRQQFGRISVTIVRDWRQIAEPSGINTMPIWILSLPARVAAGRTLRFLWYPCEQTTVGTAFVVLRLMWRLALLGVLTTVITSLVLISWRLTAFGAFPTPSNHSMWRPSLLRRFRPTVTLSSFIPWQPPISKPLGQPDWPGQLRKAVTNLAGRQRPRESGQVSARTARCWTCVRRPPTAPKRPCVGPMTRTFLPKFRLTRRSCSHSLKHRAWRRMETWMRPGRGTAHACAMMCHIQDYDPLRRAADTQQAFFPVVLAGVMLCNDPRVGVPRLRRALDDAQDLDMPTTHGSAALKLEYLSIVRELSDPPPELVERAWGDLLAHGDESLRAPPLALVP